ncbi:hypothetical protein MRQ36_02110 [Micromonospora sp. R77]|uniref:hypothetical protein n=1 Tax=Micromonospora sp. R77 TaxID=2925836 RepID=UPI001F60C41F|nr:hypothetical protein [Micromonospora sp. R77]MCI4061435.1 hypothetical protein [Micromonospora sp. R77]
METILQRCITVSSFLRASGVVGDAMVYRVYPRSFSDGEVAESVTSGHHLRLPHLAELGVDAIGSARSIPPAASTAGTT